MKDTLAVWLSATTTFPVSEVRTPPRLLPESEQFAPLLEVLATGYLVGLVECACLQAIEGYLEEGEGTLGVHVDLSHSPATPPGTSVEIRVELIEVAGRQLVFDVLAHDDAAEICRGLHRRAVIDLARFTAKLAARTGAQAAETGAS